MKIAVAKEIDPSEPRVAASPDTVKKFKALGAEIAIEPGAGIKSGLPDSEFTAAEPRDVTSACSRPIARPPTRRSPCLRIRPRER